MIPGLLIHTINTPDGLRCPLTYKLSKEERTAQMAMWKVLLDTPRPIYRIIRVPRWLHDALPDIQLMDECVLVGSHNLVWLHNGGANLPITVHDGEFEALSPLDFEFVGYKCVVMPKGFN